MGTPRGSCCGEGAFTPASVPPCLCAGGLDSPTTSVPRWAIPVGPAVLQLPGYRVRPAISVGVMEIMSSRYTLKKRALQRAGPESIPPGKLPQAAANASDVSVGTSFISDDPRPCTALPVCNRWLALQQRSNTSPERTVFL